MIADASTLHRIMSGCRASAKHKPTQAQRIKSDDARQGDAAHWVLGEVLKNSESSLADFEGQSDPDGYMITTNIIGYLDDIVNSIRDRSTAPLIVEERFDWSEEFTTPDSAFKERAGVRVKPDVVQYDFGTLYVDDLKFGYRIVEVENNWQLIAAAIGYIIFHGIQPERIVMRVHQPRPYHPDGKIRSVTMSYDEIRGKYDEIMNTLRNIDDTFQTGGHCQYCPIANMCPASRHASNNAIDVSLQGDLEQLPNGVVGDELTTLRNAMKVLKIRESALTDDITDRIKSGSVINGYGLEPTQSNFFWKPGIPLDVIESLIGMKLTKEKPLTPAQAKALNKSKPHRDIVEQFSTRNVSGYKLKQIDINKIAKGLLND